MSPRTELLQTDASHWKIGPYHSALPGPMVLRLRLDGEVIVGGTVETGFLHRGLEKAMERHAWQASVKYADHLDPEAAVFGELALCLAVEELSGLEPPPRAQAIRVVLSELTRIAAHLAYGVRLGRSVGADTLVHYLLRDRERILDLFELLTGARFSLNFLRFGGVRADVTEGFIERVYELCELIRIRLKEYNDLFTYNYTFMKRTVGIGPVSADDVRRYGITGPNARAAGVPLDVRREHPYLVYANLDFEVPVTHPDAGKPGDAHDRFLLRLREIFQSLEVLKQVIEVVPTGEYQAIQVDREFPVPSGEAYARVESSRGLLACHVMADGTSRPARVRFRTPTQAHLAIVPKIIAGIRIEDLPAVLASLDLCLPEADR